MLSDGADGGDRRGRMAILGFASGQSVHKGQVVRSVRGRDRGRWYLVVNTSADGFILVADGMRRTLSRPKRKNPRHLMVYDAKVDSISEALAAGRRVNDRDVDQALRTLADLWNVDGEEVGDTG